jgi:hypothetical protein
LFLSELSKVPYLSIKDEIFSWKNNKIGLLLSKLANLLHSWVSYTRCFITWSWCKSMASHLYDFFRFELYDYWSDSVFFRLEFNLHGAEFHRLYRKFAITKISLKLNEFLYKAWELQVNINIVILLPLYCIFGELEETVRMPHLVLCVLIYLPITLFEIRKKMKKRKEIIHALETL